MKKQSVLFLTLAVLILFGSCAGMTNLGVYDESIPEESRCRLEVHDNIRVDAFNKNPVNWVSGSYSNKFSIMLAPGENTFAISFDVTNELPNNLTITHTRQETITHNFVPGKNYKIYLSRVRLLFVTVIEPRIVEIR